MGGIYEVAVEMGSGAMIYIPSFIKNGSGIQKFIVGDNQVRRQVGDRISLHYESTPKMSTTYLYYHSR
jgi:hypothetical protein